MSALLTFVCGHDNLRRFSCILLKFAMYVIDDHFSGGWVSPPRGPPGQLHRRPSTPKRFCLSEIFIDPGFFYFLCREISLSCVFCVCFPVVSTPRLLCLFSNSFQFKFFIYSLYIHIYIFFFIFFHCTVGSLICAG